MHRQLKRKRRTRICGRTATRTRFTCSMPRGVRTCHQLSRTNCRSANGQVRCLVRVSRLVGRILLGTGPCETDPEQPSISARRCRRARATYPQTPAGRRLAAQGGIVCAGARPRPGALLVLLRVGFTQPPRSPEALVVSYTTVSPLPAPRPSLAGAAGGLSLWHFPASHLGWALPTTVPCGVRTFLSRTTNAVRPRPPGRLTRPRMLRLRAERSQTVSPRRPNCNKPLIGCVSTSWRLSRRDRRTRRRGWSM
jgi:hypothetical protein